MFLDMQPYFRVKNSCRIDDRYETDAKGLSKMVTTMFRKNVSGSLRYVEKIPFKDDI